MSDLMKPDFTKKCIELNYQDEAICIYGNKKGLKKLADLCLELIENPNQGHIHLENYNILTAASKNGVIAIFE